MRAVNANMEVVEMVCSNLDPFCPAAQGAKLYDQNGSPSLPYTNRTILSVNTNAQGYAMIWVTGSPRDALNVATVDASGFVTAWTSNPASPFYNLTTLTPQAQNWRVVSMGAKFITTQAWTDAIGLILQTDTNQNYDSTLVGQSCGDANMGRCKLFPTRDAKISWLSVPRGTESTEYVDSYTADLARNQGIFSFAGCKASSTIGYLELVIHYEFLPTAGGGLYPFATPAAPHVPAVMSARANQNVVGTPTKSIGQMAADSVSYFQEAKNALTSVVDDAAKVTNAVAAIYPPARAYAGGINAVAGMLH